MTAADGRLRYLSVLAFEEEWLDRLRAATTDVEVLQLTVDTADDIPVEIWRTVDVLHTSALLPDPKIATSLRYLQLDTSGVDHVVDTDVWRSDVPIATIGGISPVPLAEYVLFGILGFAHRLPAMLDVRQSRAWPTPDVRWQRFLPAPVTGSTLGIVGYGRIGQEIARLAGVHGMRVLGVNRSGSDVPVDAAQYYGAPDAVDRTVTIYPSSALGEVVEQCDYVVVMCPLTDETRGLYDASIVGRMRAGAVLINAARGGIVDETAVLAALRSGRLAGALVDVFDDEPLPADSPWWDQPNAFVTPHVAGLAPAYAEQVLDIVSTNLLRVTTGRPLLNLVDRGRGY